MNKGMIYKLYNEGGVYYGSTINKYLCNRLAEHKSHKNCSSRILFNPKFSNPKIELLEEFYYNDISELRDREAYYINNLECINKIKIGRTPKEWREEHKEDKKTYDKEYRKIKTTCDCGSIINKYQYKRHCRNKKHQKFITTTTHDEPNI